MNAMNGMLQLLAKLVRIKNELYRDDHVEAGDLVRRWGNWVHEEIAAMAEEKRG